MTTMLNQISDEGATHLIEFYEGLLAQNKNPLTHYEAHFTLGLIAWRENNLPLCQQHLHDAADYMTEYLGSVQPAASESVRTPHRVALPFFVIFNFGSDATKKALANIDRASFFCPESERYESLAQLLELLRYYFAGEQLNSDSLEVLLANSGDPNTDLFYRPWVTTMAQGLRAILDKNRIMVEKCVNYLLQLHGHLASEGGWEKLVEGLLSFWALTLINVAKREGLLVQCNSPYVPDDL